MKMLTALVLVLGLASAANAALSLSIIDNGDGTFGIMQTVTFTAPADNTYFMVVANTAGTIPTGGVITAAAPGNSFIYDGAVDAGAPVPVNMDGVWGYIGKVLPSGKDFPGGLYIEDIQCAPRVTVQLYTIDDNWEFATPMGKAVTLTPEPITVLLLGLGSLFLRRRK
jgi:hypothetical protein